MIHDWLTCQKCDLHQFRRNVVIGEGDHNPHVMFIGEAPGKSEDLVQRPFIGPSGRILRMAIGHAVSNVGISYPKVYITNLLACRPTDYKNGPNRKPTPMEVNACWPRLKEQVTDIDPRAIVLLGETVQSYCKKIWPSSFCIVHPRFIIDESWMYNAFVRDITSAFEKGKVNVIRSS